MSIFMKWHTHVHSHISAHTHRRMQTQTYVYTHTYTQERWTEKWRETDGGGDILNILFPSFSGFTNGMVLYLFVFILCTCSGNFTLKLTPEETSVSGTLLKRGGLIRQGPLDNYNHTWSNIIDGITVKLHTFLQNSAKVFIACCIRELDDRTEPWNFIFIREDRHFPANVSNTHKDDVTRYFSLRGEVGANGNLVEILNCNLHSIILRFYSSLLKWKHELSRKYTNLITIKIICFNEVSWHIHI